MKQKATVALLEFGDSVEVHEHVREKRYTEYRNSTE